LCSGIDVPSQLNFTFSLENLFTFHGEEFSQNQRLDMQKEMELKRVKRSQNNLIHFTLAKLFKPDQLNYP